MNLTSECCQKDKVYITKTLLEILQSKIIKHMETSFMHVYVFIYTHKCTTIWSNLIFISETSMEHFFLCTF